jgi:hypothetical protein
VDTAFSTLVKGPMTVTGFIAYAQGWGGLYIRAHKLAYQMMTRYPGLGIPNTYGIPNGPERVHWEPEFAQKVEVPGAYDYSPECCAWLSHVMTNWINVTACSTGSRARSGGTIQKGTRCLSTAASPTNMSATASTTWNVR